MRTKPLLKRLYNNIFGEELLFKKQGFSGYPNEAAEMLLKGEYPLIYEVLKFRYPGNNHQNIALQWKMMNVELFLNTFKKHI